MAACAFPNCNRNAEKNGYCIGHRHFANDKSAKKETKTDEPEQKKKSSSGPGKKVKSSKAGKGNIKK